jgi:outer membrane protein OmpA-like peptidoglycan-associated protein
MSRFEDKPPAQNASFRLSVLLAIAIVVAIGLGISLYLNHTRSRRMEQEMAALRQRMDQVAGKAESARLQATAAEQNARQLATARESAEHAKEEAETKAKQAQERAEQARERAEVAQNEKEQLEAEAHRAKKEREDELIRLQDALEKIVETRRTAMGLVMNLDSNAIQFEFDRATLQPENRELLSRIAGILLTSKGYQITVYGHTDDVGSDAYNLELSARRARTVRNYLVEAGVSPEIITTKGYGKSNPLVEGKTAEARAKNRRVEIAIVDTILDFNHSSK